MACQIAHRYMGGSTLFVPASNSVVTVTNPVTLPTSGYAVSFWYNSNTGFLGNNEGLYIRTGSTYLGRQGPNDMQAYAYLNAPGDYASGPRRLRFRNFIGLQKKGWHHTCYNFYVLGDRAKCDEYEDGIKIGATHTVDYAGDSNTPTGNLSIGRGGATFNGLMAESRFYPTLTAEQIKQIALTGSCDVAPLQDNPLDDLPANGYRDTIGGATGTGTATTYSTDTPVQLKTAIDWGARSSLSFDGVDDQLVIPHSSDFTFGGEFGFDVLLKLSTFQYDTEILGKGIGAGFPFALRWINNNGTVRFATYDGTLGTNLDYVLNWQNAYARITGTKTGGVKRLYIDGQLVAQGTDNVVATTDNALDITIGNRTSSTKWWKGGVKSARIWNRAPTHAEIIDLHFNNIVPQDGLVDDLDFNEGAGTTVYDQSGNGNNGTITGATWSAEVPNAPHVPIGGNMIKNGDFSYVPVVNVAQTTGGTWMNGTVGGSTNTVHKDLFGWFLELRRGTATYSAMFDESVTYKGKPSVKIVVTAQTGGEVAVKRSSNVGVGWSAGAVGLIPVKPSTSYIARVAIKTDNIVGGTSTSANLSIAQVTVTKATYLTQATVATNITGTQDFIEYELTFTTNASAYFVDVITAIREATGTAWFSDISLLPTTPVVNIPLSAPAVAITCP